MSSNRGMSDSIVRDPASYAEPSAVIARHNADDVSVTAQDHFLNNPIVLLFVGDHQLTLQFFAGIEGAIRHTEKTLATDVFRLCLCKRRLATTIKAQRVCQSEAGSTTTVRECITVHEFRKSR